MATWFCCSGCDMRHRKSLPLFIWHLQGSPLPCFNCSQGYPPRSVPAPFLGCNLKKCFHGIVSRTGHLSTDSVAKGEFEIWPVRRSLDSIQQTIWCLADGSWFQPRGIYFHLCCRFRLICKFRSSAPLEFSLEKHQMITTRLLLYRCTVKFGT